MQLIRDRARLWRSANGWLKAGVVWTVACSLASLVVIEVHSRTDGPFNAPGKVAVRKAVAAARIAGVLLLVLPGLLGKPTRTEAPSDSPSDLPTPV